MRALLCGARHAFHAAATRQRSPRIHCPTSPDAASRPSAPSCPRSYAARGAIAITQPRRVAAITIAQRVARERGCALGGLVGYSVRFDDMCAQRLLQRARATSRPPRSRRLVTPPAPTLPRAWRARPLRAPPSRAPRRVRTERGGPTKLKYITDGMLVREAIADPQLAAYAAVLLDEVHERSVQTDVLCAVVRAAQRSRAALLAAARAGGPAGRPPPPPPLKVVVMSATLEMGTFSAFFGGAPCLRVRGRAHAVSVHYCVSAQSDYVEAAVAAALQVHCEEFGLALDAPAGAQPAPGGDGADGDILVFLTGAEEIESCARLLLERSARLPAQCPKLLPCPMYAALSPAAQLRALQPAPPGVRKAILATTIAETSLTVPGVRYVVDCGYTKSRRFVAEKGVDALQARARSCPFLARVSGFVVPSCHVFM